MLTHSEAQALISAGLDQPLDPDIEEVLAEHLAGCPECRYFAASSQRLANALESWPTIPESAAVRQRVWEAIESPAPWWQQIGSALSGRTAAVVSTAAIALLVIALATLAIVRLNDDGGDDEGARLAAGTSEVVALATQTAAPTETPVPTQTPAPTSTPVATDTPAPTSTAPAAIPTAPDETPVDLTGDTTAPATSPTTPATSDILPALSTILPEATATPEPPAPTSTPAPTKTPEPTNAPQPTATPSPTPEPTATPEPAPAAFTVTLLDQEGEPVPDACWALVREDDTVAETCDTPDWETPEFASNGNAGFFDVPAGTYTLRMIDGPDGVSVPDQQVELAPGSDDTATITTTVATPAPAPTSTPEPTATPSPSPEPTDAPEPTASVATPDESTQSETSPPIVPDDGQPVEFGPAGTATEAATSVSGPDQRIVSPAEATRAAGGEPVATEQQQMIEPIGGDSQSPATAQARAGDGTGATVPPDAGGFDLSEANYYSDGQPWGDITARLALEGDNVAFTAMPDAVSLDGPTVQQEQDGDQTWLAVCDGSCAPATRDSGDGAFVDSPIGWVGDQLVYQRETSSGEVELRALTWTGEPTSDEQIGTAPTAMHPFGIGYDGDSGTLIPCPEGWLLVGNGEAAVIDGNPYGEPQLVRTDFSEPLIGYVAGGQLIIADQSAPGTAIATIPFNGVDFDLSPDTQRVVISTGNGLEIWSMGGELLGRSGTEIQTGSVLWLRDGIIMLDLSNGVMRMVDPGSLTS